ncbi:hypothetical protein Syun_017763 [Stephania yunnanensis]|uniref:RING-type domain-containing protein n=1 Tax=Stephania yunnanensis TaxID=152371 RepID=A0AAP0P661_9MAGN
MDEFASGVASLSLKDQVLLDFGEDARKGVTVAAAASSTSSSLSSTSSSSSCCAICLEKIELQEIALVKGCEHAYCVMCILRWATYSKNPICPQCKYPFESLILHRALDGGIQDYMQEESVCLLLRANWFEPLLIVAREEVTDEHEEYYPYEEDDDDDGMDDFYVCGSSSLRIGNRRWGSNGYVSTGRREARPVVMNVSHILIMPVRLEQLPTKGKKSKSEMDEELNGQ